MTQPLDRRVRRTRDRLHVALMELFQEKPYDKITVSDLIDRADVGRSTFYAHYDTKDDLLLSGLEHLTADIERFMSDEPDSHGALLPSLGIFHHIADNHRMFKALFGSHSIDFVHRAILDAHRDGPRRNRPAPCPR
ncbi:MAG: TetR family transcriptional regulator [Actinomycetia bacterium]|nr:TetR family transcriptional regulator [Actinomycetes bacterium]